MANKHAIERRINRLEADLQAKELRNRIALGKLVEAAGWVEEDQRVPYIRVDPIDKVQRTPKLRLSERSDRRD